MASKNNEFKQARTKSHFVKWKFADWTGESVVVILGDTRHYKSLADFINQYNTGYDVDHLGSLLVRDRKANKAVWRTASYKWAGSVCKVRQIDDDVVEIYEEYNGRRSLLVTNKEVLYHIVDKRTIKL